jgi:hypothetical protein
LRSKKPGKVSTNAPTELAIILQKSLSKNDGGNYVFYSQEL